MEFCKSVFIGEEPRAPMNVQVNCKIEIGNASLLSEKAFYEADSRGARYSFKFPDILLQTP
jgi:hypothetical protein